MSWSKSNLRELSEGRCVYCLQHIACMVSPRKFPCGHMCCLTCVEDEYWLTEELQCCACKEVVGYYDSTLDLVPNTDFKEEEGGLANYSCDRCRSAAHMYCLDCQHKLCQRHYKNHDIYFEGAHSCIDIFTYSIKPKYYGGVVCSSHPQQTISHACVRCNLLACAKCDPGDRCPGRWSHKFHSLARIERDLRTEIQKILKDTDEKITGLYKSEKRVWVSVDQLEQECDEMVYDVKKRMEEQILSLRESADRLIWQIREYQTARIVKVEEYVCGLVAEKTLLEDLQRSVRKSLRNSHVTDLLKQQGDLTHNLKLVIKKEITELNMEKYKLKTTGKFRQIELDLVDEIYDEVTDPVEDATTVL